MRTTLKLDDDVVAEVERLRREEGLGLSLLDANLLLYAVDRITDQHDAASAWLTRVLNGTTRVGIPWPTMSMLGSPRIRPGSHRRPSGRRGELANSVPVTGNLVPDAMLAALAVEHGLTVMTADTDFARFPHVRWENPLGR